MQTGNQIWQPIATIQSMRCGLLERDDFMFDHLMEPNPVIRQGAMRSATWLGGQASQRCRWPDLAHRRLFFHARWTALASACGQPDHGAKPALPANVKKRSNGQT